MAVDWDDIEPLSALARAMWEHLDEVYELPPERFQLLLDRVYQGTSDVETLWQLSGATNDYLRRHPDSLEVPPDLARGLLASNHVEARVIGLKLLTRCSTSDVEIVGEIIRAIRRNDAYESEGALYEVGNLIERIQSGQSRPSCSAIKELIAAVETFAAAKDADTQAAVRWKVEALTELIG